MDLDPDATLDLEEYSFLLMCTLSTCPCYSMEELELVAAGTLLHANTQQDWN